VGVLGRCGHGALMLVVILSMPIVIVGQSDRVIVLDKGWQLASASTLSASGDVISEPEYETTNWHTIRRMPATVLEALQEDGTYPNLYFGMNLLEGVPQDLWKQSWWYRTSFKLPTSGTAYWIDLPGINYRAQVWLNGKLVAGDSQIVGMYVDHYMNVSKFVAPGKVNVLAIKITPEQKIENVNGIELGDSYHDLINWEYLGYRGSLKIGDLPTSGLTGTYSGKGTDSADRSVDIAVTVTSASTKEITLLARVTAAGVPLTDGTVTFMQGGIPIGTGAVNASGVATLTTTNKLPNASGISFVPDRNAGIWKPVSIYTTGPVELSNTCVDTELPLPLTSSAKLTVYANVLNATSANIKGLLEGTITRFGKPAIHISQSVNLSPGEKREISFAPNNYPQLTVNNPDLWWPYTLGDPALYGIRLKFVIDGVTSDSESIRFGIRKVTQMRDNDLAFPDVGKGGNFYLQVNGRDFPIRGAYYTPDLLLRHDEKREADIIRYAKDLRVNMLRWEGKIPDKHIIELADEAGMPVMLGWMCCAQWEKWDQWNDEDWRIAPESLRSQILMLRSHPAAFIWANGSDGLPPEPLRDSYHQILSDLHWQNAIVDTVSSFARDANGNRLWDGIEMQGPYSWRPPSYWFSGLYPATRGASAEEGDNENIPPFESLKKFIPTDKLWPINQFWSFHADSYDGPNQLLSTQLALDKRYGASSSAEELARKAQLGLYEDVRAQFEDFAANGWANHKMTIYFMLDAPWPSFIGHLFDYYLKPGGAYYGAKKGLQPLSVVFDYYATGDHEHAKIRVVNQTLSDQTDLRVRVRVYDLSGKVRYDKQATHINVQPQGTSLAITLPLIPNLTSTYFIRCELFNASGARVVENAYWQSTRLDDLGSASNENGFSLSQASWADFTALNKMPKAQLQISAKFLRSTEKQEVVISLHNPSLQIAFFERASITDGKEGDEILPIIYSDNYVTVFPGETAHIMSTYRSSRTVKSDPWLSVEGYNTEREATQIR